MNTVTIPCINYFLHNW